jgi:hypothetical protein
MLIFLRKNTLAVFAVLDLSNHPLRLWWNWQTRNLEVVVLSGVQVQVLLTAPFFFVYLLCYPSERRPLPFISQHHSRHECDCLTDYLAEIISRRLRKAIGNPHKTLDLTPQSNPSQR